MSAVINGAGLMAVWRRQLGSLLGNPLNYLFILAFVVVSAGVLFLPSWFFARNIADLGLLASWDGVPVMGILLAILVPALSMGAWAGERESGTEELLLTMPLSLLDAVLGKYLAVVSYVTIALVCSLSNVAILAWLGDPDIGLMLANYAGWWFAAVTFAAWSLVGSVLVTMPAIAFVLGALFSGMLIAGAYFGDFFDPFNRGVIPASGVVAALSAAGLGLGVALLILASRRWRSGRENRTLAHCLSVVFGLALVVNVVRIADRHGVDADVSVDGIASLATESVDILKGIERRVQIAAFISARLPENAQLKAKELEERLAAIQRYGGNLVKVDRYYPKDALDKSALHAVNDFGLKSRREVVESVVGREFEEVFLGVAVTSGGRTELIEYFDPGVSVEYELIRAIRTVGSDRKPVLGVATTDMGMGPDFDFRTQEMRPPWMVYQEWKRQYEVRDVSLDSPVAEEIEALVVPQPSSLTEAQIRNLHDYIWAGRPCLMLEDPLPIWAGPSLAASQPKKSNNPYGQNQGGEEQKGDLQPLFRSLGVDLNTDAVQWSDYSPSHAYRQMLPKNFVWVHRDQVSVEGGGSLSSFSDSPVTRGFTDLLFPFPGRIETAVDKPPGIDVKALVRPSPAANSGWHGYSEHIQMGYRGMEQREPSRWIPSPAGELPALAMEITGIMPSAYPMPAPGEEAPKTVPADEGAAPEPEQQVGRPSAKPIHVILVADSDFCHDLWYQFYRNANAQFDNDDIRFVKDLRNVQLAGNLVDALVGDQDLLAVRSRLTPIRKLAFLDQQIERTQKTKGIEEDAARKTAEDAIQKKREELDLKVAEIDQRQGLDKAAKDSLKESTRDTLGRQLEANILTINRDLSGQVLAAKSRQRSTIESIWLDIRIAAILIPAIVLGLFAASMFARRLARERSHVPAARARSHP